MVASATTGNEEWKLCLEETGLTNIFSTSSLLPFGFIWYETSQTGWGGNHHHAVH